MTHRVFKYYNYVVYIVIYQTKMYTQSYTFDFTSLNQSEKSLTRHESLI